MDSVEVIAIRNVVMDDTYSAFAAVYIDSTVTAMLNILIPIAEPGSPFIERGFLTPKPLILVRGIPMVELVVNNVRPRRPHRFTFVALKKHLDRVGMRETLQKIAPGCRIIVTHDVTEGAACSVLLARDLIDDGNPLMLANCDQWVDVDIEHYLREMDRQQADGLMMTMEVDDPKRTYVGHDQNGHVGHVVQHPVVSNQATVGIFNFRRGCDFVCAASQMIANDRSVNGEYPIAPVYNEMIAWGAKIVTHNVGDMGKAAYGMRTPSELNSFIGTSGFYVTVASKVG